MKVSKRQLKRIIREEKSKLQEQPQSPGDRARGMYADDAMASQATALLSDLYDQMTAEMQEDGMEIGDAEDMAAEGLLHIVNGVLQTMGHLHAKTTLKGDADSTRWDR
jgi:hypothetical protein